MVHWTVCIWGVAEDCLYLGEAEEKRWLHRGTMCKQAVLTGACMMVQADGIKPGCPACSDLGKVPRAPLTLNGCLSRRP
jgi:hypothetical protein